MTIQEWLNHYKDTTNEDAKRIVENVERITRVHQDSNNHNVVLDDADSDRLRIQYESALTDPRRI